MCQSRKMCWERLCPCSLWLLLCAPNKAKSQGRLRALLPREATGAQWDGDCSTHGAWSTGWERALHPQQGSEVQDQEDGPSAAGWENGLWSCGAAGLWRTEILRCKEVPAVQCRS